MWQWTKHSKFNFQIHLSLHPDILQPLIFQTINFIDQLSSDLDINGYNTAFKVTGKCLNPFQIRFRKISKFTSLIK